MGLRQSTPQFNTNRVVRQIVQQPQYNKVPQQQPVYDTKGNVVGQTPTPIQPPQPTETIYNTPYGEYVDVVGSDSGNITVFTWVTQLSTCCASICTLVVLIAFVVWMYLNRSINTLP